MNRKVLDDAAAVHLPGLATSVVRDTDGIVVLS